MNTAKTSDSTVLSGDVTNTVPPTIQSILDSVGAAIISVNSDGRIEQWNRYAEDLVGLSKEQVHTSCSSLNVPSLTAPQVSKGS